MIVLTTSLAYGQWHGEVLPVANILSQYVKNILIVKHFFDSSNNNVHNRLISVCTV